MSPFNRPNSRRYGRPNLDLIYEAYMEVQMNFNIVALYIIVVLCLIIIGKHDTFLKMGQPRPLFRLSFRYSANTENVAARWDRTRIFGVASRHADP